MIAGVFGADPGSTRFAQGDAAGEREPPEAVDARPSGIGRYDLRLPLATKPQPTMPTRGWILSEGCIGASGKGPSRGDVNRAGRA